MTPSRTARLAALLMSVSLLLAACARHGGEQPTATVAASATTSPTASTTTTAAGTSPTAASAAARSFVVHDDTGAAVALRGPAQRIMSLTPGTTEMLFAAGAGDHVIATVLEADVPQAARKIPRVGDATALDYEKVINARADVVVAWKNINSETMIEKVRSLGLPVYLVQAITLRDIPRSIERLGALAGTQKIASEAAAWLDRKIDLLDAAHRPKKTVTVFYEIWEGPLYTIGGEHIISDALRLCGARNVFGDLKWPANIVTREAVIKRDPDIIIVSAPIITAREWAGYWAYYPEMRAVANKKVKIWTDQRLDRMGPGAIDATAELCKTIDQLRPGAEQGK